MSWFRLRIQFGGQVAVFALTLFLVQSFSHIDIGVGGRHGGTYPLVLLGASTDALAAMAKAWKPYSTSLRKICGICTLMQMANSAQPASSPEFLLRVSVPAARAHIGTSRTMPAMPHALAQARAPPIV